MLAIQKAAAVTTCRDHQFLCCPPTSLPPAPLFVASRFLVVLVPDVAATLESTHQPYPFYSGAVRNIANVHESGPESARHPLASVVFSTVMTVYMFLHNVVCVSAIEII